MTAGEHKDVSGPGALLGSTPIEPFRALSGGADAVLLADLGDDDALRIEVANHAALVLCGLEGGVGEVLDVAQRPELAPLVARLRDGATRARTTRENVALQWSDGARIVVDVQVEPLPDQRVLAVVRLAEHEPAAGAPPVVGLFRTELGLGAVFVDEALLAVLGLSHEAALGHGWIDALHPDDRTGVMAAFEQVDVPDDAIQLECRLPRGAEDRIVRVQAVPVRGDDGTLNGYLASLEDVTDERREREAGARLAELADVLDEWIAIADAELRLLYANPAARRGLTLPQLTELPTLALTELIAVERRDAVTAALVDAIAQHGTWSGDLPLTARDGRPVTLECTILAHPGFGGGVAHYSLLGRDVTQFRSMQQELHDNEERFRRDLVMFSRAVESTPDLVSFHDATGRLFWANAATRAFYGIAGPDEIPPLTPAELTELTPELEAAIANGIATEGSWTGELVARAPDGTRRPVSIAVVAHYDDAGRIEYFSSLSRDLTEHKRTDAARRRSEAVLRAIVQSSPLAIFALDGRGTVHVWNRAAEAVFGWTADDVVGAPLPFLSDDGRDDLAPLLDRVFAGETIKGYRARYVRRDGDAVDVDLAIAPLRNADGKVVTAVAALADVTEQTRATQALVESEVWFRSLVQHSSDMVMVLAVDGTVAYASPTARAFTGAGGENLRTRSIAEVVRIDDEYLGELQAVFARLRATANATERVTFRVRRADGELRWIEMVATNLFDDPAVRGIVVNGRDITESFEADVAVRASEERLQTLLASVSESERALRESESRLRESEARYRAVVDDQIELVCRYLPDTTITFVNRAFADFYARTPAELIGSHLIDLYPEADRPGELERLARFSRGSEVQTYDDWEIDAQGARRWYRWFDRAFIDERGRVVEFQSVGHDITDEHRASVLTTNQADILEQVARGVPLEETLRGIAGMVEAHFPRLSCALYLLDDEDRLRLGAAPNLPRRFVNAVDGVTIRSSCGSCCAAAARREPVYVTDATTDSQWEDLRAETLEHRIRAAWSTPILGSDGRTVLGTVAAYAEEPGSPDPEHRRIFSLVAHLASIAIERKDFEDRLAHESMHDPLTALPNRLLFLDRLGLAIARGKRTKAQVAVLFLDLDRFKNVNDSLGHDAGDELLVSVARRLESVLRPGDTVARFGGDEFTILCEDLPNATARDRALEIAQRLLSVVARPFVVRGAETFVGVSIGIALTTTGDETADELLRDADAAMYHAKDAGRGRVEVFDDTMRARALARHATENALHRAIERGELRLFFQPVVALTSGECIGVEALVRWQHPERGLVGPAEFVPLAEETGLIVPLGSWVLEQAATQAAHWQLHSSTDFVVSINLSARQVAEANLADEVAGVIERTGVRPSNLCFEITETALMDDAEAVMRVIERVRALGVCFAIDDFGTGYSSLGYLKRFSVDTVKIDRAFVDGLADDEGDRAIVSAVIGLAHALGLKVVAEGVEREAQLVELIALGCDEAQGYFFAPPQPAADLGPVVARNRHWRPPGSHLMGK
jgi:diguanylate cyclase (GGDEF)-like protein/PAS domain S-box-containing protein